MNRFATFAFFLILLPLVGCARQVVRAPEHGVVAIPTRSNAWPLRYLDRAAEMMSEHFPDGYVIEHEEEAVVGEKAKIVERHKEDGTGVTRVAVDTSEKTEWRIYYRRL